MPLGRGIPPPPTPEVLPPTLIVIENPACKKSDQIAVDFSFLPDWLQDGTRFD